MPKPSVASSRPIFEKRGGKKEKQREREKKRKREREKERKREREVSEREKRETRNRGGGVIAAFNATVATSSRPTYFEEKSNERDRKSYKKERDTQIGTLHSGAVVLRERERGYLFSPHSFLSRERERSRSWCWAPSTGHFSISSIDHLRCRPRLFRLFTFLLDKNADRVARPCSLCSRGRFARAVRPDPTDNAGVATPRLRGPRFKPHCRQAPLQLSLPFSTILEQNLLSIGTVRPPINGYRRTPTE